MDDTVDDIVWVLCSDGIICGTLLDDMVWDRPGGGAAPNMLEKAASRWKLFECGPPPYSLERGGPRSCCWYSAMMSRARYPKNGAQMISAMF